MSSLIRISYRRDSVCTFKKNGFFSTTCNCLVTKHIFPYNVYLKSDEMVSSILKKLLSIQSTTIKILNFNGMFKNVILVKLKAVC